MGIGSIIRESDAERKKQLEYLVALLTLVSACVVEIIVYFRALHSILTFIDLHLEEGKVIGFFSPKTTILGFNLVSFLVLLFDVLSATFLLRGWSKAKTELKNHSIVLSLTGVFQYLILLIISIPQFSLTTWNEDMGGIMRRLPPTVEQNDEDVKVKERNVMTVLIDKDDRLLVNGHPVDISQLTDLAKDFMTPHPGDETAPEVETKTFDLVGDVLMSKGIIFFQSNRGTSYAMYISVQNELARAFNELKEDLAWKKFHKHLDQLAEEQTKAINNAVPVRISEAEPINN